MSVSMSTNEVNELVKAGAHTWYLDQDFKYVVYGTVCVESFLAKLANPVLAKKIKSYSQANYTHVMDSYNK